MPVSPLRRGPLVSRRDVLAAVVAGCGTVLLAGCTGTASSSSTPRPGPTGSADPDAALRTEVAGAEQALAARYAAAAVTNPTLVRVLAVGARHEAYAAAVEPATGSPTVTGPAPATSRPAKPVPDAQLLASLAAAERRAAAERVQQCAQAHDPQLVRVLALAGAGAAGARAVLEAAGG